MKLIGIDPVLSPDLLWVLASMGHGDDLALVDANFPADSISRATASKRLVRLPNVAIDRAAQAILSVYPLDGFVEDPARRMEVVGHPDEVPIIQSEVQAVIDAALGQSTPMWSIERYAFYEAAKKAFAVVQVGDARAYGCFLLRKGVVFGDKP